MFIESNVSSGRGSRNPNREKITLVKLELQVGDSHVKGEFSPDMARMIFNEIVKNGKTESDKIMEPVKPTEPVKPVKYHRRPNKAFITKYTDIFNQV
jgi:hypothetical protein